MRYKNKPGNASVGYYRKHTLNARTDNAPLRVIDEAGWNCWLENGFIIIPNAVPQENVDRLVDTIWKYDEKDPHDPSTWYRPPRKQIEMTELVNSGMVELYQHQFLWDNRQNPKVYNTFVDIWGMEELWVSIDRANLNFPVRPGFDFKGFIHWDIDTSDPDRNHNVQGVLSLTDTDTETGGFQCVPQLFREFDTWVKSQPEDRDPFMPDITGFKIKQIETKAGDLLVWNSMLAHGIRPNRSGRPRIAQYISMTPAEEENAELREWRIRSWREKLPPEGYAFPGDPRNWEKHYSKIAELTVLGEKLLGLRNWKD